MPNWCENKLTITGPVEQIIEFRDRMRVGKNWIALASLDPYPTEYDLADRAWNAWTEANPNKPWNECPVKRGFDHGGHRWRKQNWGTKWEPESEYAPDLRQGHVLGELTYRFDTAWTPPNPLIEKAGELYPELLFDLTYFEGGVGFQGRLMVNRGRVVIDECLEYSGPRGG